ncbi:alpha/beta hydrolase family protein [Actinoallomurus bryophytorum]|uniref:Alpha/beta hydrolase family protein n=1 Tax=Actinoallomurus bryophytorum TaxID=1490222 RepID=A0A543CRK6_9ACTN|nr:alpha/beta hydrolase [Actinoallomurus bryophytorum]TQL99742.1 alpha/beta hydrolase family protein [Actinoallomurus bryophytorum]
MRTGRATLVALTCTALVLCTAAAGEPSLGPIPLRPLPALTGRGLAARYAADSAAITEAARGTEDPRTSRRLRALAAPGRTFLDFDPRGRAVEVVGDLATARRVAVLVPGADTTLSTFDSRGTASPGGGARAVYAEARRADPGARLAVIAWLGYDTPATLSPGVLTAARADEGARELRPLVAWLDARGTGVALLCHSYGTVVCGRAAKDLDVTDIAVFGSPGLTVSSAAALHSRARLWAGRAAHDFIRYVPKIRVLGVGFGTDPAGPGFGARRFAAGDGGHSDYLSPGSVSLRNLAMVALGRTDQVSR